MAGAFLTDQNRAVGRRGGGAVRQQSHSGGNGEDAASSGTSMFKNAARVFHSVFMFYVQHLLKVMDKITETQLQLIT